MSWIYKHEDGDLVAETRFWRPIPTQTRKKHVVENLPLDRCLKFRKQATQQSCPSLALS